MFHADTKLFSDMNFQVHFIAGGSVSPKKSCTTFRVDVYNFDFSKNVLRTIFEVCWLAMVLLHFGLEMTDIWNAYDKGEKYLTFDSFLSVSQVFLNFLFIWSWFSFLYNDTRYCWYLF